MFCVAGGGDLLVRTLLEETHTHPAHEYTFLCEKTSLNIMSGHQGSWYFLVPLSVDVFWARLCADSHQKFCYNIVGLLFPT